MGKQHNKEDNQRLVLLFPRQGLNCMGQIKTQGGCRKRSHFPTAQKI